jgi:hypothetical protein
MMAGPQTFGYVTGQPLAYFDPWGLCQLAVRQGYYILGWKSCDGGDQPGSASPPRPNPRPSPAPASCRAPGKSGGGNCPGPYNPNIPLANIPYHMEGSAGGVCTINCAIKKSLQFGAKEMSVHKGLGYAEGKGWIGGAVEGICGRLALAVGLAIFVGDMDACRSECTILTPVLD